MNRFQCEQGRRARRRRDGRADRRPSGQRARCRWCCSTCRRRKARRTASSRKAIDDLKKLKPAPLGVADDAALIQPANYEEHLEQLERCDLVIEAIAERMDWKLDLYKKIAPHRRAARDRRVATPRACRSPSCREALPEAIKPRFCGIHFFNPPRYMALVELIPTPTTEPEVLDQLETFVTSSARQGRGARQGHAELHRQPRRHRRHAGDDEGGREVRPQLRRGRRPDRQEAGPRQLGHLPHRRRGGPRHDGARRQDDAGQPAETIRSIAQLRHAAGAGRADRAGRARPEDRRRLLQEGRQGHPAPRPGEGRLRAGGRQGRRDRRAHAEEAGRPSA